MAASLVFEEHNWGENSSSSNIFEHLMLPSHILWRSLITSLIFGLFPCAVYQMVLSSGLNVFLLSPVRGPGLLSLNKEGIFSTFGEFRSQLLHESRTLMQWKYVSFI